MRLSPCPLGTVSNGSSEQLQNLNKDERGKKKETLTNPRRLDAINEFSVYLQLISSNVITLMIINIVKNKSHSGDCESLGQVFRMRRVQ